MNGYLHQPYTRHLELTVDKSLRKWQNMTVLEPLGPSSNLWMMQWKMARLGNTVLHTSVAASFYHPKTASASLLAKPTNRACNFSETSFIGRVSKSSMPQTALVHNCSSTTWKKELHNSPLYGVLNNEATCWNICIMGLLWKNCDFSFILITLVFRLARWLNESWSRTDPDQPPLHGVISIVIGLQHWK